MPEPSAPTPTKSGGPGSPAGLHALKRRAHSRPRAWLKFFHSDTSISGVIAASARTSGSSAARRPSSRSSQSGFFLRRLGRAAPPLEAVVPVLGVDAEEGERAAVLPRRVGDALLVLQDQQPRLVVAGEQAAQLRGVATALDRVGGDRLDARVRRPAQPVRHARAEALDRVAEHDQQLRLGRGAREQPRRPEVVHVARRPLADDLARLAREQLVVGGDVGIAQLLRAEAVEEVQLLAPAARRPDLRVPEQRLEPPRGAGALGPDADEVGRACGGFGGHERSQSRCRRAPRRRRTRAPASSWRSSQIASRSGSRARSSTSAT